MAWLADPLPAAYGLPRGIASGANSACYLKRDFNEDLAGTRRTEALGSLRTSRGSGPLFWSEPNKYQFVSSEVQQVTRHSQASVS